MPASHAQTAVRGRTSIAIESLGEAHRQSAVALLGQLRVSLFGVDSNRLYAALVGDALTNRIDCRVATLAGELCGMVIAAPRSYWRSAPLRHAGVAVDCLRARVASARQSFGAATSSLGSTPTSVRDVELESGLPPRTWSNPCDAWRIIVVGTAPEARGLGVAATLYRSVMRDRSLVARIAPDNTASIRLHRSVGWRLYADDGVVLAVHVKGRG